MPCQVLRQHDYLILVIKNVKFGTMKFCDERYHGHKMCLCSTGSTLHVFYDGPLLQDVILVAVYNFNMRKTISAQLLWSCLPFARKGTTSGAAFKPSKAALLFYECLQNVFCTCVNF